MKEGKNQEIHYNSPVEVKRRKKIAENTKENSKDLKEKDLKDANKKKDEDSDEDSTGV